MTTVELHPEIEPVRDLVPIPDIDANVLPIIREMDLGEPPQLSDAVTREDFVVTLDGDVRVRVHRPVGLSGPLPCLYSTHGGGYIFGSFDMDDAKFDRWCQLFGIVGVSVEYRLAPETPFPPAR